MSQQIPTMFVSQYSKKKPTLLAQQTGKKKKRKPKKKKWLIQRKMIYPTLLIGI